jgi:hypothetical protein
MYPTLHLARAQHDEWLRYAETRRLITQAAAASRGSARRRRRLHFRRPTVGLFRPLSQG